VGKKNAKRLEESGMSLQEFLMREVCFRAAEGLEKGT
jgi:hypothetical protein